MKTPVKFIFLVSISLLACAALAWTLVDFLFASKTIAYGCFHQVAHKGVGCAALIQKSDGRIVLRLTDFKTADNPDLHVLLISAPDALENETVRLSRQLYVAPLRTPEGAQQYVVPAGQNLTNFHSVVIWQKKHGVNFTTAPLRRF